VQYRVRTIMVTVAIIGPVAGGYPWLRRYEPVLSQELIFRTISARMAEAHLVQAKALRGLAEFALEEASMQPAPGGGDPDDSEIGHSVRGNPVAASRPNLNHPAAAGEHPSETRSASSSRKRARTKQPR
jgi:hypothetical protein